MTSISFPIYSMLLVLNFAIFSFDFKNYLIQSNDFNALSIVSIVFYITLAPLILGKTYELLDNIQFYFHLKKINKKRGH